MSHNGSLRGQSAPQRGFGVPPSMTSHPRRLGHPNWVTVYSDCLNNSDMNVSLWIENRLLTVISIYTSTLIMQRAFPHRSPAYFTFKRVHNVCLCTSLSVSLLSPSSCSHSLSVVPYSPSSLSCSNWMCSRRISVQLLAAVESNSAHTAFSTNRCRSISLQRYSDSTGGERKRIFVPGGCTINTEQDILLLLPLSLYTV